MAEFIAVCWVAFTGDPSWAEGNANWVVDNTAVLADQAALVDPDGAARTSYAMVLRRDADGQLSQTGKGFHLDVTGQRVDGPPPDGAS